MKQSDLLLLGGAALLAYILFKDNGAFFDSFSGGGGAGGGGFLDFLNPTPSPGGGGFNPDIMGQEGPVTPTASNTSSTRMTNVSPAQSWTGVTYGTQGQPSVRFLANTIQEASSPAASAQVKNAKAAAYAGAPPRVVAKIKAGKIS